MLPVSTVSKPDAKEASGKQDGAKQLDAGLLRRLLGTAWRYRWACILPLLIQVLLLTLGLLGLGFTGLGVDIIRHAAAPDSVPPPHFPLSLPPPAAWSPTQQIIAVGCLILLFSILRGILTISNTLALNRLVQGRLVVDMRAAVYDKLQRLSFRFYDANDTGSIINRVTHDVQTYTGFISGVVLQVIMLSLSICVYFIYMVRISPRLTFACLATTPLLWFASSRFSKIVKPAYRRNRELYDVLVLALSENLSGIHVVKGFGLRKQQEERFHKANMDYKLQQRWLFWRTSIFGPGISYLTQINLVILFGYGGWMVIKGQMPLGTGLMVFAGVLSQFAGQIQQIAGIANTVQQALTAARRIYAVLDTPLEIQSPPSARRLPKSLGKIEFRNVSFEFDPGKPVLKDISFTIQPGQCVAMLGSTGAGKSILLSLIPRFYDPTQGQILIDDVDIRDYDLNDLRRTMGLVFQESFLFTNTIATNIAFGSPDATRSQIESAARLARAHDFVSATGKGYDTIISEGATNLSGGQKQRLAIARALIREPAFLLMDDPMAAVDAQTEHEMLEAMESAMHGRTTIVAANRISTLRRADVILVMTKGRIVQRGTHDQLMLVPGPYRDTAKLQIDEEARKIGPSADVGTDAGAGTGAGAGADVDAGAGPGVEVAI